MRQLTIIAAAALTATSNLPLPGTCSVWIPQTNGIKWRMCSDIQSNVYCEMKRGRTISRMRCP